LWFRIDATKLRLYWQAAEGFVAELGVAVLEAPVIEGAPTNCRRLGIIATIK